MTAFHLISLILRLDHSDTHIQEIIESIVDNFDVSNSESLNASVAEFFDADDTVSVDVHHFEVSFDESAHCLGEWGMSYINRITVLGDIKNVYHR